MIDIVDKNNCCGCTSCLQSCPQECITLKKDIMGFSYPVINQIFCVQCNQCEKVCPALAHHNATESPAVYAAINNDEQTRSNSSSGGIFSLLANNVLSGNGVVFGAAFDDNWNVCHIYIDSIDDLAKLRGAKYSQSIIGDSYRQTKDFLNQNKNVLFTGTPCQIAGLKAFLRKEYDNLTTVEIACHGVPSPKVWSDYLMSVTSDIKNIGAIEFRDKRNGWNGYGLSIKDKNHNEIVYEKATENTFMQLFLKDLIIRPSCTNCQFKSGKSGADILLGDFWGIESIHPEFYDNKGCSLVIAYTPKGENAISQLDCKLLDSNIEEASRYNPCILTPAKASRYAPVFSLLYKRFGYKKAAKTLNILNKPKPVRIMALLIAKTFTKL